MGSSPAYRTKEIPPRELLTVKGDDGVVLPREIIRTLPQNLFNPSNKFTELQSQGKCEAIGHFDADANLSMFDGADISPMNLGSLGELLLRKADSLALMADCPAKADAREFCCPRHTILLISSTEAIYRRSSTGPTNDGRG